MALTVSIHRVVRISFEPIAAYPLNAASKAFATRQLVIEQHGGEFVKIPLFAETPEALRITDAELVTRQHPLTERERHAMGHLPGDGPCSLCDAEKIAAPPRNDDDIPF